MENLSEHISIKEAIKSPIAKLYGLYNTPNDFQLENMRLLAKNVFEPLRKGLGGNPIIITSFFRSMELNYYVGGAIYSQHLANKGAATDIDNDRTKKSPTNREIFDYIRNYLTFDQLISEFPLRDGSPDWVHVSYNIKNNRKKVLKCIDGHYYPYS